MIFGSGSLAKAALEIFTGNEVVVYGFLDDDPKMHGKTINDINILGAMDDPQYLGILGDQCDAFVALDDNALKAAVVQSLRENNSIMPVNALHRTVSIASTAQLHHGCFVDQLAAIGTDACIGNHCVIRSSAVVDHESNLGDYVQVGARAVINAGAICEDNVFIGSGSVIVSGIKIGEGARVGAGSVVISDVPSGVTVFGNPAKPVE